MSRYRRSHRQKGGADETEVALAKIKKIEDTLRKFSDMIEDKKTEFEDIRNSIKDETMKTEYTRDKEAMDDLVKTTERQINQQVGEGKPLDEKDLTFVGDRYVGYIKKWNDKLKQQPGTTTETTTSTTTTKYIAPTPTQYVPFVLKKQEPGTVPIEKRSAPPATTVTFTAPLTSPSPVTTITFPGKGTPYVVDIGTFAPPTIKPISQIAPTPQQPDISQQKVIIQGPPRTSTVNIQAIVPTIQPITAPQITTPQITKGAEMVIIKNWR